MKNRISPRTVYKLHSYLEEMCMQILLPHLKDPVELQITIEYSEAKEEADVVIWYNGDAFDPQQTDNELSLLMAKNVTADMSYDCDMENDKINMVQAKIV